MVSIIKGYECVLAVTSKSSTDKIDMLRAMGATIYVCPANVSPQDPRSYYQVAKRLNNEIKEMSDLNRTELYILSSLVFITIFFGFYPDPLINTIEVSISDLIEMYNYKLVSKF